MKRITLFHHPIHPMISHFPIALWSMALVSDLVYFWRLESVWAAISCWNIALGLVVAAPASLTGLLDFFALPAGETEPRKTAVQHMLWVLVAAAFYLGSLFLRFSGGSVLAEVSWLATGASGVGLAAVSIGGWLGGKLVFTHRAGVSEEPRP